MRKITFFLMPLLLLAGGCTHYLSEQSREGVDRGITFERLRHNPDAYLGKTVLLGGVVTAIAPYHGGTRLEVEEHRPDSRELPDATVPSRGCFFAVSRVPLDPARYEPGALVTLVGKVAGKGTLPPGGGAESCPVIDVVEIREIVFEEMPDWGGPFGGI